MNKIKSTLVIALLFAQFSIAQIKVWESPKANKPIQFPQWEVNDLVYHVKKKVDAPFKMQAYAVMTGEEGMQKTPLYYPTARKTHSLQVRDIRA